MPQSFWGYGPSEVLSGPLALQTQTHKSESKIGKFKTFVSVSFLAIAFIDQTQNIL